MATNLDDTDTWTEAPTGPGTSEPLTSVLFRGFYNGVNNRARWVRNRLAGLFGTYQLISSVSAGGDTVEIVAHGIPANTVVRVESVGGSVPAGLSATVAYYVLVSDADNIQLSLTSGGAAVDITGAGSGTLYLYRVVDALGAIMSTAFTTSAGNTIAPGSLRTLLGSFLALGGGTMTGPLKMSGNGAYKVERDGVLADATPTTFSPLQKDWLLCPDVSAATIYIINDGTEEGQTFTVTRRQISNGFTATFKRSGGVVICGRFVGTGIGWMRWRWENQDGGGAKWHISEFGGDVDSMQ